MEKKSTRFLLDNCVRCEAKFTMQKGAGGYRVALPEGCTDCKGPDVSQLICIRASEAKRVGGLEGRKAPKIRIYGKAVGRAWPGTKEWKQLMDRKKNSED